MIEKLWFLIPEMILLAAAVLVSIMGLSRSRRVRDLTPATAIIALIAAMIVTPMLYSAERISDANLFMPHLGQYVKVIIAGVGVLLVMINIGAADRRLEDAFASGRARFNAMRLTRGEYFAFLLLGLVGVMLCCNATDLIWLFLALELTSLPTYVLVAISRGSRRAQEAAMKYFFLGAMSAAVFLYGFALLYGATGSIEFAGMRDAFAEQAANGGVNPLGIVGMILAVLGVSYKIAAAPMHFYTPDVYEGASAPVTAFLAFTPKLAGMLALIVLLSTMGWSGHYAADVGGLPRPILTTLWMLAVLTMTLGNIGALLQHSIKRMLAYSSIAHSGYLLLGIIAGPSLGIQAVLFYMLVYGVMNTAAFAVIAGLEQRGREIETLDDLAGLRHRHPMMAAIMALSAGSLLGLPPLLGFWGKLLLFIAAVQAGHVVLVVIAGLNSAISAWYYLALVRLPLLESPSAQADAIDRFPTIWPRAAGLITAIMIVIGPVFAGTLIDRAESASKIAQTPETDAPLTGGDEPTRLSSVRSDDSTVAPHGDR